MATRADYVRELLSHMGIDAEVRFDDTNERLVVIDNEQYLQKRVWIETWFTLIDQDEKCSYFHERERGTGKTI